MTGNEWDDAIEVDTHGDRIRVTLYEDEAFTSGYGPCTEIKSEEAEEMARVLLEAAKAARAGARFDLYETLNKLREK
jgi:hypothetical protein